jgi:hypothetical protein
VYPLVHWHRFIVVQTCSAGLNDDSDVFRRFYGKTRLFFVMLRRRCAMFTYRVMRAAYPVLWMALVFVSLVCRRSYSQVADALPLDDPNAVVRTVLAAVKAIELPAIGRGTATMVTEGYDKDLDGKELIVDFVFKDQKSRRDIFESSDGSRGRRWYAQATSDKFHLNVNPENAAVDRPDSFTRRIPRDFHPEAFMRFMDTPLAELLEALLKSGVDLSVTLDGEGILHVGCAGHVVMPARGEEYDSALQYSFDTQKGLRPVLYRVTLTYPDKEDDEINKLRWAKFDSVWYVSHVEHSVQGENFTKNVEFTVKSFDSNPEVSDKEFTLDGLGIPHGMLVFDSVAGVQYRYGSPPPEALEDLEKPLAEADFVQRIREHQGDVASQPVDANAQQRLSDPNHALAVDETHADSLWPRGIVTASIVVLIGVVVCLGYRYAVARAESGRKTG